MDAIKCGYEVNRRILMEGLPRAGCSQFLPVDGAFYLHADVSRFCSESLDFAHRMREEAGAAMGNASSTSAMRAPRNGLAARLKRE